MQREKESWSQIKDNVVHTEKVHHVTFYLVTDKVLKDWFAIYSESEKRGLELLYDLRPGYDDMLRNLQKEIQELEEILESKRKGIPTAKQLHFLFRERIPIPLELTWGEASNLIDERLNQKEYEKQKYFEAKAEKYNGFLEGVRAFMPYGRFVSIGEVTKLTSNNAGTRYAYVKWDSNQNEPSGYTSRVDVKTLYKTQDEAQAKIQTQLDKFNGFAVGDRVSHLFTATGKKGIGNIDQLREVRGVKYINVLLDDRGYLTLSSFDTLQKIEAPSE